MFLKLYDWVVGWASKPNAPYYLGAMSFAESSFFPVPPDVLLAPMCLARPNLMWRFATITTIASILGGLFGYGLGAFASTWVQEMVDVVGCAGGYQRAVEWFKDYGIWAILIAGFSPIPYKLFTIAAGVVGMPLIPFFIGSALSRGARFFLVAGLTGYGQGTIDRFFRRYLDRLGWWIVFGIAFVCLTLSLSGCGQLGQHPAPVALSKPSTHSTSGQHRVEQGETIYSIAWLYGEDVRELARLNHLSVPYHLKQGQLLLIHPVQIHIQRPLIKNTVLVEETPEPVEPKINKKNKNTAPKTVASKGWYWPSLGKVILPYSGSVLGGNQGIDIAGKLGDPIRAAGAGKVVYRGEGIRGYGQLVIIKHADNFLSAYAHNHKILVGEGDSVKAGDVIAEMGQSGTDQVKLHFEIRKEGKPVDPRDYLPSV